MSSPLCVKKTHTWNIEQVLKCYRSNRPPDVILDKDEERLKRSSIHATPTEDSETEASEAALKPKPHPHSLGLTPNSEMYFSEIRRIYANTRKLTRKLGDLNVSNADWGWRESSIWTTTRCFIEERNRISVSNVEKNSSKRQISNCTRRYMNKDRSQLINNSLLHLGTKPHQCAESGMKFDKTANLKLHEKIDCNLSQRHIARCVL